MRSIVPVIFIFALFTSTGYAQTFRWSTGFDGFLDNREYFSIDNPQSIFGSRVWGEVGADINEHHGFRAGLNYLYEFGSEIDAHLPDLTMYYQYEDRHVDLLIGAFPRRDRLEFPQVFLSDTLNYFRPNMEGTFLGYRGERWNQQVFLDWTSRQTDHRPERFIFGFAGRIDLGIFFLENNFMMAHLAGKGIPEPGFHLRDNGGFSLTAGVDLSRQTFPDSLSLGVGPLVSLDRTRGVDPGWQTPAGFLAKAHLRYRMLGSEMLYYRGAGHTFFYGDPFYRLGEYGRLDLFLLPFRQEHVHLKINFVLHFAAGQVDYSQQILLSLNID